MSLDIVIWEYEGIEAMIAVPLTEKGCKALSEYVRSMINESLGPELEFVGGCPLEVGPEEFMHHIASDVSIYVYMNDALKLLDLRSIARDRLQ